MGFDNRDKAKTYARQEGDTLKTIAERETTAGNAMTWQELARFNFGTEDPDTLDEYLRDELGCRKRDDDNHFLIAEDDEGRTDLILPQTFKKADLPVDRTHTLRVRKKVSPPQFLDCASIPGVTFEFDKSFVRPTVVDAIKTLETAIAKHPDAKIMIFGHTDKVGPEGYNKKLSERRARSTYAFITNQPAVWEALYKEESWGIRAVQEILKDMGDPYDPGPVDGIDGPQTQAAVKKFQTDNGLTVDGIAGPDTRNKLFAAYMTGKHDVVVDDARFMDPKDMGCGELNPLVETEERNEENRRVTFFLFNDKRLPRIPCQHGDLAPCNKQKGEPLPRFKDEFHCSFYDSIAKKCLCEHILLPAVKVTYLPNESDPCKLWDLIIDEGRTESIAKYKVEIFPAGFSPVKIDAKVKRSSEYVRTKPDVSGPHGKGGTYTVRWDGKDDGGKKVAPGKYTVELSVEAGGLSAKAVSTEVKIIRIGIDQIRFDGVVPLKFYDTVKTGTATYVDVDDDIPVIQWTIKNLNNAAGDAPYKEPKLSFEKLSSDVENYSYPVCYIKASKVEFKARLAGEGYEQSDKIKVTIKETGRFAGSNHTEVAKGNEPTFTATDKNRLPDKISKLEDYVLDFLFEYDDKGQWKKIGVQKNRNHTFYTILDKPVDPWGDGSGPSEVKPWVSVLDKLCTDWARDQTNKDDTAAKLVEKVFHSGFRYATRRGGTSYTSGAGNRHANLKQWMNRLNGLPSAHHNGDEVNCTDCATVVTSLSNILGCELWSSRFGYRFRCHKIISIGFSGWEYPFPNPAKTEGGFRYHEIGWKGSCDTTEDIFDPCLKVASNPVVAPATSDIYPRKMTYNVYEPKLVWSTSLASVAPDTSAKIRRKVR